MRYDYSSPIAAQYVAQQKKLADIARMKISELFLLLVAKFKRRKRYPPIPDALESGA